MVNDLGEAIVAFVAMPETRQIAQPKKLNITNNNIHINSQPIKIGKVQHHIAK